MKEIMSLVFVLIKLICMVFLLVILVAFAVFLFLSFFNMKPKLATPEYLKEIIKEYPCAKIEFTKILEKEPVSLNRAKNIGKECQAKIDSEAEIERQRNALE